ncbi:MAG: DUF4332 domain-containing protein [Promethearchaeota archaeon]
MDSEFSIAELACIASPEKEPLVEITTFPENKDQLTLEIDELAGDVVFHFFTKYRESTKKQDEPSFAVTVKRINTIDAEGQIIASHGDDQNPVHTLREKRVKDRYGHYDTLDRVLTFNLPHSGFNAGTTTTKIIELELEATLRQWEWSEDPTTATPLEEPRTENRRVTVSLVVYSVCTVDAEVLIVPGSGEGDYTTMEEDGRLIFLGDWKHPAKIQVTFTNNYPEEVEIALQCREEESGRWVIPYLHLRIPPADSLPPPPDTPFMILSEAIVKEWEFLQWSWGHEIEEIAVEVIPSLISEQFNYQLEYSLISIGNKQIPTEPRTLSLMLAIKVPLSKRNHVPLVNQNWEWAKRTKILEFAFTAAEVTVGLLGVAETVEALIEGVILIVEGLHERASRLYEIETKILETECPTPYDSEYRSSYQPPIRQESTKLKLTPRVFKEFFDYIDAYQNHRRTVKITYNRYMSAKKDGNFSAAKKQKMHAIQTITAMEDTRKRIQKSVSAATESITRSLASLREKIMDFDVKEVEPTIRDSVLTTKEVNDLFILLRDETEEGFVAQVTSTFQGLAETVVRSGGDASRKVERMRAVDDLCREDMDIELLKDGVLSMQEFYNRRGKRAQGSNYLIAEFDALMGTEKQKLYAQGITTTHELLDACSATGGITKLSEKTGIPRQRLLKLLSIGELMRVKGVGDDEARVLHATGIKSRKQLAKAGAKDLRKKIRASDQKIRGRTPTQKQVNRWIKEAKDKTSRLKLQKRTFSKGNQQTT